MATGSVDMELILRTEKMLAKLKEIPGVSEAEAKKMAAALSRQWAKAEQASEKAQQKMAADAKKAAEKAEQEWNKGSEAIAKKLAAQFGGVGNDLLDLAGSAGGAIGSVGVAAAGAAAGVAVLATATVAGAKAIHEFIASADDAIVRLDDIAGADPIPPETTQALEVYRQASLGAETAAARLQVQVAGLAAAAFEPAASAAGGLLTRMDALVPSVDTVSSSIELMTNVGRAGVAVLTLGVSEAVRWGLALNDLADAAREAADDLEDQARSAEALKSHEAAAKELAKIQTESILKMTGSSDAAIGLAKEIDRLDEVYNAYVKDLNLADEATRLTANAAFESIQVAKAQAVAEHEAAEAKKAHTEALRIAEKVQRRVREDAEAVNEGLRAEKSARLALAAVVADATSDQLTEEDKVNAAYQERITKIREAEAATLDYAAGAAAEAAAEERRVRDLAAIRIELEQSVAAARSEADTAAAKVQADAIARTQEALANVASGVGALHDGLSSVQSIVQGVTDAMIEQAETGTAAEKAAAKAAFNRSKALAIVLATIDAARAAMALIPAYAYLGPGAPFAAAATAGLALAAQVAQIQSVKPPSYQRGGMVLGGLPGATPDHVQGDVQPGEFIATKADVQRNGGPRGVEQVLRGGRQQPVRVQLSLNGRQVAEAMWDPLGSLSGGAPLGRRPAMG